MNAPDHRLPLYQRLRDQFAQQIAQKSWQPDVAIPTEVELAARYGAAVGTVRKALDELVIEGMIERQQGRGSFVRRPNFEGSLFRFFRLHGPDGQRVVPEGRILDRRVLPAPPDVQSALGLEPAAEAICLQRLRLVTGAPVLLEEIWLPRSRFIALLRADDEAIGALLYPAYERLCGEIVARAQETMTIGTASEADMTWLGLRLGDPVVVIERLSFGYDNIPLEWRRTHGIATAFRYHIEIR